MAAAPILRSSTRDALLDCAERLFAEFGIEAVSPRRVALAAGQRNQSAIRYHFGSKDDLIAAVYTTRTGVINERRRAMLLAMEKDGRIGDLRALIATIALPLAELIDSTTTGRYYIRFLAHLFADRQRRDRLLATKLEAAPLRRLYRLLRLQRPELPDALWAERLRLVIGTIISALADRERMRDAGDPAWRALSAATVTSNLIDISIAVLTAPASPETRALIGKSVKSRGSEEKRYGTGG
jgi:AcrR family transcriptional regulator